MRFDGGWLAVLNESGDDGSKVAAVVQGSEQGIAAIDPKGSDAAPDALAVKVDASKFANIRGLRKGAGRVCASTCGHHALLSG